MIAGFWVIWDSVFAIFAGYWAIQFFQKGDFASGLLETGCVIVLGFFAAFWLAEILDRA